MGGREGAANDAVRSAGSVSIKSRFKLLESFTKGSLFDWLECVRLPKNSRFYPIVKSIEVSDFRFGPGALQRQDAHSARERKSARACASRVEQQSAVEH